MVYNSGGKVEIKELNQIMALKCFEIQNQREPLKGSPELKLVRNLKGT